MINEANERLIMESLSISKEVEDATMSLCDSAVGNAMRTEPYATHKGMDEYRYWKRMTLFKHTTIVYCTLFNYTDQQIFDKSIKAHSYQRENKIDARTGEITLTFFAFRWQLCPEYCEDGVRHELTHFYEWCQKKDNGVDMNIDTPLGNAYDTATKIVMDPNRNNNYTKEQIGVAWLIYWSNWGEQSAMTNAFPSQAKYDKEAYLNHDTDTEYAFSIYKRGLEWLKRELPTNPNVAAALKAYNKDGIGTRNIITYVSKNFNRFKNKINHARASIHNTMTDPTRVRRYEEEYGDTNDETKRLVDSIMRKVYEECWE